MSNKRICDHCGKPEMHVPVNKSGAWFRFVTSTCGLHYSKDGKCIGNKLRPDMLPSMVWQRVWIEPVTLQDGKTVNLCQWCRMRRDDIVPASAKEREFDAKRGQRRFL